MGKKQIYFLNISGNTISDTAIKECISLFKKIKAEAHSKPLLEIVAKEKIIDVDFSFLGHLILIKKSIPQLDISLVLLKNLPDSNEKVDDEERGKSVLWKLRQFMVHAYYCTNESVFTVTDANGEIGDANINNREWFVLSKKFLPIVFLDEPSFETFFESKNFFFSINENKVSEKELSDENKLYQSCRRFLFKKISFKNYLHILSQLAFYRALRDVKLLRYYQWEEFVDVSTRKLPENQDKEKLQISNVQDSELKKNYKQLVLPIFEELSEKSPIYYLVFSTLLSSDLIPNRINNDIVDETAKKIHDIWEFAKELIYGLNELSKNIVEHSTNKQGIVSGFIDSGNNFIINVFDHGKKGILETLLESTTNKLEKASEKSELQKLFKEDELNIKNKEFKFSYFFDFKPKLVLNQQTKRATAHLGLLIFSKLIEENDGSFDVVSFDTESNILHYYSSDDSLGNQLEIGANYHILLPIAYDKKYHNIKKISSPYKQNEYDKNSIRELLKCEEVNSDPKKDPPNFYGKTRYLLNVELTNNSKEGREFEETLWSEFEFQLNKDSYNEIKSGKVIICIGFKNVTINASQLFRFLGRWELELPAANLILYDIKTSLFFELIKINKSYTNNTSLAYWNHNAITLIYSYEELEKHSRFYFTDALWGDERKHFIYVNSLIRKNNYNAIYHYPEKIRGDEDISECKLIENNLFYKRSTLLPFDLLIKGTNQQTIFECNSKTLLCSELGKEDEAKDDDKPIEIIKKKIENLPGFKISESHFRLGSKVHISDFYYAKRYFQNSFFASRFAFIITKYINEIHDKEYIEDLTLIGYGLYSELLISLVSNFLKDIYEDANINHNLFTDSEEPVLVKGYEQINKNLIIIVPIASTFSTSIKIEEYLKKEYSNREILNPHINALVVSNGNMLEKSEIKKDDVEWNYGWKNVRNDIQIVDIASLYDREISMREQKFFISLPSTWYPIEKCEICSPHSEANCFDKSCSDCNDAGGKGCPISEKVLLSTDKSYVTPALVFDFPRARDLHKDDSRQFSLNIEAVEYGHTSRNDDHFHYYFYDEKLFEDNKEEIREWLAILRNTIIERTNYTEADNVLIVAPEHFSNTVFVHVVNEMLFSNSANVLHYNVWKNNFFNFQTFYKKIVLDADKIFFVDDTIISGATFFRSNDFIKFTKKNGDPGFDACIVLLSRINYFAQYNIQRKLPNNKRFFAYANVHLPTLKEDGSDCQLCIDFEKTKKLFDESYLDRFKHHFKERMQRLSLKEITLNSKELQNQVKPFEDKDKNLRKIESIHRIFEYFQTEVRRKEFLETEKLIKWQEILKEYTNSPFKEIKMKFSGSELFPLSDDTCILLKVLALPPFNIYKPLKEKVFKWTVELLNSQIEEIKKKEYKINYYDFRDLKFLIRRAGILSSNYLLSDRFFQFIVKLHESGILKKLREEAFKQLGYKINYSTKDQKDLTSTDKENISKITNIDDFGTYVVAQIKELLYHNESKCIVLEKQVKASFNDIGEDELLKQLFRMLQEENGTLIKRFGDLYKSKVAIKDKVIVENDNNLKLNVSLENFVKNHHYQYKAISDFLEVTGEKPVKENSELIKYIQIQSFLSMDESIENGVSNLAEYSLQRKTQILCDNLKELIFGERNKEETGMFLLVKYKSNYTELSMLSDLFLAYNSGEHASDIDAYWDNEESYITRFVDGIKNSSGKSLITIDELLKSEDEWLSLYSKPDDIIKVNFLTEIENVNHILLMRLSLKSFDRKDGFIKDSQGVLVFYSKKPLYPINKTRYLLLLKDSVSRFIKNHHKNNEFRDWKEAYDAIKTANLAGHSREMLMEIAKVNDRYKQIVLNMEHLQAIIKLDSTRGELDNHHKMEDLFEKFYHVKGEKVITKDYIDSIKEMGDFIFKTYLIENTEKVDIINQEEDKNLRFSFSRSILDIICFEIFVNAKKNRWIFLQDEKVVDYDKNVIKIKAYTSNEQLILSVSNTGPMVERKTINDLNNKLNPKGLKSLSGIALVQALLKNFNAKKGSNLGEIKFSCERMCDENNMGEFIVTLTLNEMIDG